jgi:hypothetical protein
MALSIYQDEQLDDLDTSPDRSRMIPSNSDYHHFVRGRLTNRGHHRSTSKFSVYHEEHLASKHSFFDDLPTEAGYDPSHLSRQLSISPSRNPLHDSTVRRHQIGRTAKSSLRVEALKRQNSKRVSALSKRSRASVSHLSVGSKHSRTLSLASTASLGKLSPVPVATRRHKRNVSFNHLHRASPVGERSGRGVVDLPRCDSQVLPSSPEQSELNIPSSPPVYAGNVGFGDRTLLAPHARNRGLKKVIDLEARKASNELSKVCEEAFNNRSSISEKSCRSSGSEPHLNGETPPSSISNGSVHPQRKSTKLDPSILNRPLPPVPQDPTTPSPNPETPGTYTARELRAVRQRLANRYAQESPTNQHFYNDVMRQLDNLMPGESQPDHHQLLSIPLGHSFLGSSSDFLQAIPEESRGQNSDELLPGSNETAIRHYNGPARDKTSKNQDLLTIRIVEPSSPSSPSPWAPLNIRKASGASNQSSVRDLSQDPHEITALPGVRVRGGSQGMLFPSPSDGFIP